MFVAGTKVRRALRRRMCDTGGFAAFKSVGKCSCEGSHCCFLSAGRTRDLELTMSKNCLKGKSVSVVACDTDRLIVVHFLYNHIFVRLIHPPTPSTSFLSTPSSSAVIGLILCGLTLTKDSYYRYRIITKIHELGSNWGQPLAETPCG